MFSLQRIYPGIFHVQVKTGYQLASLFLRYQEYYECLDNRFYNNIGWSVLEDYAPWYAKTHGKGAFDYHSTWSGFNIPGHVLDDHFLSNKQHIRDFSRYDQLMEIVYYLIKEDLPTWGSKFYLIGTSEENEGDDERLLDHELSHAFYTVDPNYKKKVNALLKGLPKPAYDRIYKAVKELGYHPSVVRDEVHAYSATGLCEELERKISKRAMKPFQKLFKEKMEQCQKDSGK